MVVLESLPRTLVGVGVGLAGGYLLAQPLARSLPAATNAGASAYVLVASILLLTTVIASWLPARRAGKAVQKAIDPDRGLRQASAAAAVI